jgi:hypothetical protein
MEKIVINEYLTVEPVEVPFGNGCFGCYFAGLHCTAIGPRLPYCSSVLRKDHLNLIFKRADNE